MNDSDLRTMIKLEVARLNDGELTANDIRDDEPLFSFAGEVESRIDLDSLDALELAFAIEEATGLAQQSELDYQELKSVNGIVDFVRRQTGAEKVGV